MKGTFLGIVTIALAAVSVSGNTDVRGTVTDTNGAPLKNVVVSDGHSVAYTDSKGNYRLNSPLDLGLVFVSTPDGYEPAQRRQNRPQFWADVKPGHKHPVNFKLRKLENDSALAVIIAADLQVANRVDDRKLLRELYVPEINRAADSLRNLGMSPILITLGDQTCDFFWYKNDYRLPDFNREFTVNVPVYHTMGNHDNDPYIEGDVPATATWRKENGPAYYSFNRGGSHFVVLDNMIYINDGGRQGHSGNRHCDTGMTDEQLDWLEKDLAAVKDKNAPLFLTMHGILLSFPVAEGGKLKRMYRMKEGVERLDSILKPFTNVIALSGHAHNAHYQHHTNGRIREYNYPACMGTWWSARVTPNQTNYSVCRDGSPRGIGIWNFSGERPTQIYKGFGYPTDFQIKAYDLNTVTVNDSTFTKEYLPGNPDNKNVLLANIWAYEPGCSVKMYENGKELKVKNVMAQDPVYFNEHTIPLFKSGVPVEKPFQPEMTAHMFRATAETATAPVTIEFRDIYGNVFRKVLERGK